MEIIASFIKVLWLSKMKPLLIYCLVKHKGKYHEETKMDKHNIDQRITHMQVRMYSRVLKKKRIRHNNI
jgi:hypothetical protein